MMHGGMHERHGQDHGHHGGSWRATLTSEQKSEIAMSHLRMQQKQALAEGRIALKEAEIAALIAGDEGDDEKLQAGVDELVALKKELLLSKYQHLREVRQLLTPQQRISFDLWVLAGKFKDYHR
jgi:Spy/CpxP family protein refolding chaperone